jgi:hypothetical protein
MLWGNNQTIALIWFCLYASFMNTLLYWTLFVGSGSVHIGQVLLYRTKINECNSFDCFYSLYYNLSLNAIEQPKTIVLLFSSLFVVLNENIIIL